MRQRRHREIQLGGVTAIHRGLRHSRALGRALDGEVAQAAVSHEFAGGGKDRLVGLWTTRSSRAGGLIRHRRKSTLFDGLIGKFLDVLAPQGFDRVLRLGDPPTITFSNLRGG